MSHKRECLLLIMALWVFNVVQGPCSVGSGSQVKLLASLSGATLAGNFNVVASCTEKRWRWLPFFKKPVSRDLPLCAEVSTDPLYIVICSGLSLQYTEHVWGEDSQWSECYSVKYQQIITKGRGAKLACNSSGSAPSITEGESVSITFPLATRKELHQNDSTTGFSFMMQVNKATTICVCALLNISDTEERDQIAAFFNTSASNGSICNSTVNWTISSRTAILEVFARNAPHESVNTEDGQQHQQQQQQQQQQPLMCASQFVEKLVLALIILVLLSLVIVLGATLIYTNCCRRKPRRRESSVLLSNSYTDSSFPSVGTNYIRMKVDPSATTSTAEDNSHVTSQHAGSIAGGSSGDTCSDEAEANYAELENCSQRSTTMNGGGYSHLRY